MQKRPPCDQPAVPAEPLEAEAWRVVGDTLLDREHLRAGLAQARKANRAARRRAEQVEHLKAEIRQRERSLEEQVRALLKVEGGSSLERALRKAGNGIEAEIRALRESLAELEAAPIAGLSDDDTAALEQFAEKIRAGLENARPHDRHRVYGLLRLRGAVVEDAEHGVQLRRRRFAIDWTAVLELRHETTRLTTRPGT